MSLKTKVLKLAIVAASVCTSSLVLAVTEIKIAFNQSENHPQYLALKKFGEAVAKQTDGRYRVEIFQDALLGDQSTTLDLVRDDIIQMATVAGPLIENYEKSFRVLSIPFIYTSPEHQEKVFTSNALDALFTATKKDGFEVLAAYTAGARSIYNNVGPVKKVSDMGGQKIRVMQSDTMVKMLDCLGGSGIPMGQGEVYSAIKQNIIDGGENNEIVYADFKHYEVAPYYSTTRHLMVPDLLIASAQFLDNMPPEDLQTIRKLAKKSTVEEFKLWAEQIDRAKRNAIDNGAIFTEIDNTPFRESCESLQKSILQTPKEEALYDAIQSLQ